MQSKFWNKRILGIQLFEIAAILVFYLFCAMAYDIAIWASSHGPKSDVIRWKDLFDLDSFLRTSGLDYLLKLLLTIPIWWLLFRLLKNWKLQYRLLLHLLFLPIFTFTFKAIYYNISDLLGWWRLSGGAQVWDIYIPGLFYIIQFSIFHAYEYYHSNQKNLKLKAKLREAALNSELSALKAQLNPHFLYNVFNVISASVPAEQENTRELIAKLSDLFRYQLKASKTNLVPLGEELDFIEKYLDLEKARFEDRLAIKIEVPTSLRKEPIPPMILQPLVENAVKHGIAPLIEGGRICIQASKHNDRIHFRIADTGVGVQDKSRLFNSGVGLTNTKLRLEKEFGSEMIFLDNTPQGLIIEFSIGIDKNYFQSLPIFRKEHRQSVPNVAS